jgi:hypothetical protein
MISITTHAHLRPPSYTSTPSLVSPLMPTSDLRRIRAHLHWYHHSCPPQTSVVYEHTFTTHLRPPSYTSTPSPRTSDLRRIRAHLHHAPQTSVVYEHAFTTHCRIHARQALGTVWMWTRQFFASCWLMRRDSDGDCRGTLGSK